MSFRWRALVKRLHPEGIPFPGSVVYNALSRTEIFRRHYERVARDVCRHGAARRILDIGTGPGRLLKTIRRRLPGATLVGLDISPAMAAQARANMDADGHRRRIAIVAGGADALPLADATFDCVVSTGSLHHWKDPLRGLAEIHRVLAPGGRGLIYDLVRRMPPAVCRTVRQHYGGFRLALLWLHSFEEPFLSAEEMAALGRQSALAVDGTRFVGALCCLMLRKTSPGEPAPRQKDA